MDFETLVIGEDRDKIWITGGIIQAQKPINSTEIVTLGEQSNDIGPEMPLALYRHCVAMLNSSFAIIMGGVTAVDPFVFNNKTLLYNFDNDNWTYGPDLEDGIDSFLACNVIRDSGDQTTIVVATCKQNKATHSSHETMYL